MTAQVWKVLSWVGLAVLGVGALVGLIPVSSGGASCGSAFFGSDDAYVSDLVDSFSGVSGSRADSCDDLRSLVRIPAIVLLVLGAGLTITSAMQWSDSRARDENAREGQVQG
jgi:hypothetical protein